MFLDNILTNRLWTEIITQCRWCRLQKSKIITAKTVNKDKMRLFYSVFAWIGSELGTTALQDLRLTPDDFTLNLNLSHMTWDSTWTCFKTQTNRSASKSRKTMFTVICVRVWEKAQFDKNPHLLKAFSTSQCAHTKIHTHASTNTHTQNCWIDILYSALWSWTFERVHTYTTSPLTCTPN